MKRLLIGAALGAVLACAAPAAATPPHVFDYGDPPAMLVAAVVRVALQPAVQNTYRGWDVSDTRCSYRANRARLHCRFTLRSDGPFVDSPDVLSEDLFWSPTIIVAPDTGAPDAIYPDLSGSVSVLGHTYAFVGPLALPDRYGGA